MAPRPVRIEINLLWVPETYAVEPQRLDPAGVWRVSGGVPLLHSSRRASWLMKWLRLLPAR